MPSELLESKVLDVGEELNVARQSIRMVLDSVGGDVYSCALVWTNPGERTVDREIRQMVEGLCADDWTIERAYDEDPYENEDGYFITFYFTALPPIVRYRFDGEFVEEWEEEYGVL